MEPWYDLPVVIAVVILLVILGMALVVLWKIVTNRIDLTYLIAEPDNKASLSRFQFLIFTFVVAGVFLLLCIESGTFVNIPDSVLALLGISGGSYVISKGISANASKSNPNTEAKGAPNAENVEPNPPKQA